MLATLVIMMIVHADGTKTARITTESGQTCAHTHAGAETTTYPSEGHILTKVCVPVVELPQAILQISAKIQLSGYYVRYVDALR